MKNLSKSFGSVQSLKNVDFQTGYGEVVGLVGDNGAGKSTLIKVLTGIYQPDKGEMFFDGRKTIFSSPARAREAGIETVYQDMALVDTMNIVRNFFLGKELTTGFLPSLDMQKMQKICTDFLATLGIRIRSPDEFVSTLSGGERQAIAIARALYFGVKLLVLDEPTAALSVKEARKVLDLVLRARERGLSIILIAHNIYHIFPVVDRFVVLERGEKLGDVFKKDVSEAQIVQAIATGKPQWP